MRILKADKNNAQDLAFIIKEANKDVSKQFSLTLENCPSHPSFCTKTWILDDMKKGSEYFLYEKDDKFVACVSFVQAKETHAYLNRLCVLNEYQGFGIGKVLVDFIISYSKDKKIKSIGIAIIKKHEKLKSWYLKLGFKEKETRVHEHLPFDVLQMKYFL